MAAGDIGAVMRIERSSNPWPWPALFFLHGMRSGWSCWVLECYGAVKGYGVMRIQKGQAHILNLRVAPTLRGRGLGTRIMAHLLSVAAGESVARAWLEVRPDNAAAIALYRRIGFSVTRRHKDYYPSPRGRQDALVMVRRL